MKKIILLVIITMGSYVLLSQSNNWKTSDNKTLLICDTCQTNTHPDIDDYLVDSISGKPFTGLAISVRGNWVDTCSFENGVKRGQSVTRILNSNDFISRYDYFYGGFVSNTRMKSINTSSRLFLVTEFYSYRYHIVYKPNCIKLKLSLENKKKTSKQSIRFSTYSEFEDYFYVNLSDDLYERMRAIGIFNK